MGKPFELIDRQERIIRDLFGVIKRDPAGSIKPNKEKSTEKIDGTVATIMALDSAIRCGNDTGDSIYDEKDLFVL